MIETEDRPEEYDWQELITHDWYCQDKGGPEYTTNYIQMYVTLQNEAGEEGLVRQGDVGKVNWIKWNMFS